MRMLCRRVLLNPSLNINCLRYAVRPLTCLFETILSVVVFATGLNFKSWLTRWFAKEVAENPVMNLREVFSWTSQTFKIYEIYVNGYQMAQFVPSQKFESCRSESRGILKFAEFILARHFLQVTSAWEEVYRNIVSP